MLVDKRNASMIASSRSFGSATIHLTGRRLSRQTELGGDLPVPSKCHALTPNTIELQLSDKKHSMLQCSDQFRILFINANFVEMNASYALASSATAKPTFNKYSQLTVKECILNSAPKSCELDPIPSKLLIECLDSILPSLTDLFNSSLASGIFSQYFKSALVTPILKKRCLDHNDLNNYRPVSNLCLIAKILEKLVLSQASSYLNSHNLYNTYQSAYRPGHGTETALLKVVNQSINQSIKFISRSTCTKMNKKYIFHKLAGKGGS